MGSAPKSTQTLSAHPHSPVLNPQLRAVILGELEKILESPPFRGSSRRKDFLSYVVRHSLDGEQDLLKERIIGTEVFHRDADYATGDDPVVRVQAGEVRRRLEQYYYTAPPDLPVRIEIPIGCYSPVFHWHQSPPGTGQHEPPSAAPPRQIPDAELSPPSAAAPEPAAQATAAPSPGVHEVRASVGDARSGTARHPARWPWAVAAIALTLALAAILGLPAGRTKKAPPTALDVFWAPVFQSSQPVIICLAKPVVYRPSLGLYERYTRAHPGSFQTEAERDNEVLPLDPSERLTWGDMEIYPGYGVASGDTFAAVQISNLLVRMGKPSQVRIGNSYSFEDLRTHPAVVLGAFNNRWTMQMTSNLHFTLSLDYGIREQGNPVGSWSSQYDPRRGYSSDYGVVTRLLDAKSGQFLISAAGIGSPGTQAAGELISSGDYLSQALRTAPLDWAKKNMQVVVQTNVIDSVPGPPQVVATYFW